jgi:cytochrome c553
MSLTSVSSIVSALALALAAAACGTTSEAAPASAGSPKAQPATTGDATALCVEVFTRNRTCTAEYIPALVDVRAKYDKPAGIAAEVQADRAGVIAQAMTEWATDSTDQAIAATCAHIAANPAGWQQADADAARACLAQTDCGPYTACIMPLFEKRFAP